MRQKRYPYQRAAFTKVRVCIADIKADMPVPGVSWQLLDGGTLVMMLHDFGRMLKMPAL